MLFLTYVDLDIVGLGVFTNDHTLVNGSCGTDEERSSVLSLEETVGGGNALLGCNERGGKSCLYLASEGLIACKESGNKTFTAGIGKKLGAVAEKASCGNGVEELLACAVKLHIVKSSLSCAKLFHNCANVLLGYVNDHLLDRLAALAIDLLIKHSGVGAAKLVALTAHILYKYGKVHFSSSRNAEGVGGITVGNSERNVLKKLAVKARSQVTGGNELTLLTCEGRIVYREGHLHRGLAYLDELKGLYLCGRADGIAYRNVLTAREADNVANLCLGYGNALKSVKLIERNYLCGAGFSVAVEVGYSNALSLLDNTALDTSDTYSSDELVIVDRGNEKLKRVLLVTVGSRHIFQNSVKKRSQVCTGSVRIEGCGTCSARAEEHRRIELLVGRIKLKKKLKHLVAYLVKTGIGTVYLINNDDDSVIHGKSLFKHEASLGHRSLSRVNEKNNAVNHLEDTLNLTAEVCVTGGVDNVDLYVLVVDSRIFCKYGNTSLTLEVVRVHNSVFHLLIFTVDTALTKHLVNESGLSVVNVSNDRNVS